MPITTRTEMTARGRPRQQPSVRGNNLALRVTDEELQAFQAAADDAERTLSDWIRFVARKAVGLKK